jgi:hypothetical protein
MSPPYKPLTDGAEALWSSRMEDAKLPTLTPAKIRKQQKIPTPCKIIITGVIAYVLIMTLLYLLTWGLGVDHFDPSQERIQQCVQNCIPLNATCEQRRRWG